MGINFNVSKEEHAVIVDIAQRAHGMARKAGISDTDMQTWVLDITATHRNGCPLRLTELLAAEDFDFAHDVFGIRRHLDRMTGHLGDCFLPRFSAPTAQVA